jgi:hypothetical protein
MTWVDFKATHHYHHRYLGSGSVAYILSDDEGSGGARLLDALSTGEALILQFAFKPYEIERAATSAFTLYFINSDDTLGNNPKFYTGVEFKGSSGTYGQARAIVYDYPGTTLTSGSFTNIVYGTTYWVRMIWYKYTSTVWRIYCDLYPNSQMSSSISSASDLYISKTDNYCYTRA